MSTTKQEDEIDYLHPDGKPAAPAKSASTVEEKATAEKSEEKSLAEVDGHHVCSASCQKHHQI